jgi:hypothetical protein
LLERVALQVTGPVAGRVSNNTELPSDKSLRPSKGTDRKIERREHVPCAEVGIRGSGTEFLLWYNMLMLDWISSNSQLRERLQYSLYLGTSD